MKTRVGNRPTTGHRAFGEHLEQVAALWLQSRGMRLLRSNFQCRTGEIDLIMSDEEMLVFVEVRYRRSMRFGGPLESVTPRKRRNLLRCASFFLATQGHPDVAWRFDVLGISPRTKNFDQRQLNFQWIRNAFAD